MYARIYEYPLFQLQSGDWRVSNSNTVRSPVKSHLLKTTVCFQTDLCIHLIQEPFWGLSLAFLPEPFTTVPKSCGYCIQVTVSVYF